MTAGKWSERTMLHLVALVYDASVDPRAWPIFLKALAEAGGAAEAAILPHNARTGAGRVFAAAEMEPEWARRYETTWGRQNPWVLRGAASRFPGSVRTGEMICSPAEVEASDFYQEFLRPMALYHSVGACISRDGGWLPMTCLLRSRRAGPFDGLDVRAIEALVPHMRRALQIGSRLARAEGLCGAQAAALDRLACGCLMLDSAGTVMAANRAASCMAAENDGLSIRGGVLCAAAPGDTARLRALTDAVCRTIAGRGFHAGGALALERPSGRRPLNVLVLPYRGNPGARGGAVAFVTDPEARAAARPEILADLFGITAAEGRVAAALLAGETPESAAGRLGLSAHTVRNQLKSIFSKTGTGKQAELVRLLVAGLAPVSGLVSAGPAIGAPPLAEPGPGQPAGDNALPPGPD